MFLFGSSVRSDPGTPQSVLGTPHSDGEASGRENQSDDEKWGVGGAKSDQSEDEENKHRYSDEDRENSEDEEPRNRKSGRSRTGLGFCFNVVCKRFLLSSPVRIT